MNILFVSLGCDKNLVDTEVMLGLLAKKGHQMIDDETQADIVIVNTCCFIHDAKEESIETLLEMAEWKKKGHLKVLIANEERFTESVRIYVIFPLSYSACAISFDFEKIVDKITAIP